VTRLAWLLAVLSSVAGAQSELKVSTDLRGVDPMQTGAKCDGATDDAAPLRAAIESAKTKGLPVVLPAATCAYGSVLNLDGVKLIGRGDTSVLWALDPFQAAIFLRGSGSEVRNLKLTGVKPTKRHPPWEGARIVPFGASKFVIDNVTIDGSTATGIQTARGATQGTISNNRISNTLGDGIHITGAASYITIVGNLIHDTGDDGIAVVSYRDQGLTHHITAVRNTVSNNRGGRSMSVVGGSDVLYENNRLSDNAKAACLYLAQEDSWKTLPISNVIARNNTLTNCGNPAIGHAAVMLFAKSSPNVGVQILRNDITQSGQQAGIRMFGPNNDVAIDGNRVSGGREALQLPPGVKATPYSAGNVGAQ
jgi:parallel beta-helix repeat protein